jgi:hypothetical protein
MTTRTSGRPAIRPWWGLLRKICPLRLGFWTRYNDVSIAWTYSGDMSISASAMLRFRPAELREQSAQAAKLDELIWANMEEIGYGG